MVKDIQEWYRTEIAVLQDKPDLLKWLSEEYCFRDPFRPTTHSSDLFYSPADGVIIYQKEVDPSEDLLDFKGMKYTLQDAFFTKDFNQRSLVIGIFMTFYDVHVNRIPMAGHLSFAHRPPMKTYNASMLDLENSIFEGLVQHKKQSDYSYLHTNERVINRVFSPLWNLHYYMLQIADLDINVITPFTTKQNRFFFQGRRFSQIRYGSQVDLVIPLSDRYELTLLQKELTHVEAGVDPLVAIKKVLR